MTEALAGEAIVDIEQTATGRRVRLRGPLTIEQAVALERQLCQISALRGEALCFDLSAVTAFDTTGAWLIYRTMRDLRFAGAVPSYTGATATQEGLIDQALINDAPCPVRPHKRNSLIIQIEEVGKGTVDFMESVGLILSFLGLVLLRLGRVLVQPRRLRLTSTVYHIEQVGLKALPIVGLLCYLIGLVIVQQGAEQLRQFGADVFVVDLVGIATLRELGILLAAIIAAGRSGSAFTAQIGSMKLQEEVDAMQTIGLDPIETLVLPRLLALVIVMPLITIYADLMMLAGGATWSWLALDITPDAFISRLQDAVSFSTYQVGVVKAPVFGLVIAVAGCFNGLAVSGGASSVGERTTQAVVQSIFMVIVLDAAFAVFFTAIGW